MRAREGAHKLPGLVGEPQHDDPTVIPATLSIDQTESFQAVRQAGDAVVAEHERPGQFTDGEFASLCSAERHEDLMLLRRQTRTLNNFLGKMSEAPYRSADGSERPKVFIFEHAGRLS